MDEVLLAISLIIIFCFLSLLGLAILELVQSSWASTNFAVNSLDEEGLNEIGFKILGFYDHANDVIGVFATESKFQFKFVLGHELIHRKQHFEGRSNIDKLGVFFNELEANIFGGLYALGMFNSINNTQSNVSIVYDEEIGRITIFQFGDKGKNNNHTQLTTLAMLGTGRGKVTNTSFPFLYHFIVTTIPPKHLNIQSYSIRYEKEDTKNR